MNNFNLCDEVRRSTRVERSSCFEKPTRGTKLLERKPKKVSGSYQRDAFSSSQYRYSIKAADRPVRNLRCRGRWINVQGFSATVANDSFLEARGVELVNFFQILDVLAVTPNSQIWLPRYLGWLHRRLQHTAKGSEKVQSARGLQ